MHLQLLNVQRGQRQCDDRLKKGAVAQEAGTKDEKSEEYQSARAGGNNAENAQAQRERVLDPGSH